MNPAPPVPEHAGAELQRAVLEGQRADLVQLLLDLSEMVGGRGDGAARFALQDDNLVGDLVHLARAVLEAPVASPAERQRVYAAGVLNHIAAALATSSGLVGGADLAQRATALRDRVLVAGLKGSTLRVVATRN